MNYQDLINAEYDAAEALRTLAKTENRVLSNNDLDKIEAHIAKANEYQACLERENKASAVLEKSRLANASTTVAPVALPSAVITDVKEAFESDPKAGFKTERDYLMAVMGVPAHTNAKEARDKRLRYLATAGSDENHTLADQFGGFLIPEGFNNQLLQVTPEADPTASRVTNIPMGSPVVKIPARVDKNHSTSVAGGILVSRKEETQAGQTSRMKFEQVKLEATTLFGAAFATDELLNDSPISFAAILDQGFNQAIADAEFEEKLKGTGNGSMLGVRNSAALISVTRAGAGDIDIDDVLGIRSRMYGYQNAIWLANQSTITKLAKLQQGTGASFSLVYMPSSREDMPDMLMGRPIFYSEYMENLGTAGDLGCYDWSQYLVGSLQGINQAESIHVRFLSNEKCFKFWKRNDGRPWWNSVLTPKNSAPTLSPFVELGSA